MKLIKNANPYATAWSVCCFLWWYMCTLRQLWLRIVLPHIEQSRIWGLLSCLSRTCTFRLYRLTNLRQQYGQKTWPLLSVPNSESGMQMDRMKWLTSVSGGLPLGIISWTLAANIYTHIRDERPVLIGLIGLLNSSSLSRDETEWRTNCSNETILIMQIAFIHSIIHQISLYIQL